TDRNPQTRQPVHRGKYKAFCFAVVPSQPAEHADVSKNLLIGVHAETIFQRAYAPRCLYVRRCAGPFCQTNRIRVRPRIGVVHVAEQPHRAIVAASPDSDLAFENIAAVAEKAPIEPQPVGRLRHGCAAIPQGPSPRAKLVYPAPSVPARICGIVPCTVVHGGPTHELDARIVRVSIVIKEVLKGKLAERDRVPTHRPAAGELILPTVEELPLVA